MSDPTTLTFEPRSSSTPYGHEPRPRMPSESSTHSLDSLAQVSGISNSLEFREQVSLQSLIGQVRRAVEDVQAGLLTSRSESAADLKKRFAQLEMTLESLKSADTALNSRLDDLTALVDASIRARFDRLDAANDSARSRFDRVDAANDSARARFDRLEAANDSVRARLDRLDAGGETVRARLEKIDTATNNCLNTLDATNNTVKARLDELQSAHDAIKDRFNRLELTLVRLDGVTFSMNSIVFALVIATLGCLALAVAVTVNLVKRD
ncbi:hypothetical protein K474DRAFT_1714155 [Panus rudis PR-1116 ss-1]|nr:hypothetical protein K474DRAFT_1714155 [Panus rudis PR-1116 ss-1]